MSYHVNHLHITNDKENEVKNIRGGSNKNLDGAKSWLNKQHNRLWESVEARVVYNTFLVVLLVICKLYL